MYKPPNSRSFLTPIRKIPTQRIQVYVSGECFNSILGECSKSGIKPSLLIKLWIVEKVKKIEEGKRKRRGEEF